MNRHVNANDTVEEVPYENETENAGKQQNRSKTTDTLDKN